MLAFLFVLNVIISVFAVFSLLRDSEGMRQRGLGAISGIFWWTLMSVIWILFAFAWHFSK